MRTAKKRLKRTTKGRQSTTSKGRMIEAIVASMHEAENVKVERNVKVPPVGSQEPTREIDVLLSSQVLGYPVRWAIECKNWKQTIDVPHIDGFVGKLKDMGIPSQFGIFVTTSSYSSGAKRQAEKEGIRLLVIKDVLHDLGRDIQQAIQNTVFLLPIINGLAFQNFVNDPVRNFGESLVLFNKQGEKLTSIPDQIWLAWIDGRIQASIGQNDIGLEFPDELYQNINGRLTLVQNISVKVKIVGLVLQFFGNASYYRLDNALTQITERQQIKAHFDPLQKKYPLQTVETEEQLREVLAKHSIVSVTNCVCLPRLNFWNALYWPPSERAMKTMAERMQAFEAGLTPDPRPFNIADLEGTDLSAIFEDMI